MKHFFTLILGLLVTVGYAQKKELKQAQKLFKASKIEEAKASLSTNQAIIEGSDDVKIKTQYHFLKGQIARLDKDFQASYDNLKSAEGNSSLKTLIKDEINTLLSDVINSAVALQEEQNYGAASDNLFLAYLISNKTRTDLLYYSASFAANDVENYPSALERYIMLRDMNYTGVTTKYYVTEKETNEEKEVQEVEYNIYLKSKDYINPRTEDTESYFPEIVKNIALIYKSLGEEDKAIEALELARASNPKDTGLILTEANYYYSKGDISRFQDLVKLALEIEPTNAALYYNLGVTAYEDGKNRDTAQEYYLKAIELDPKMTNAYINLTSSINDQANEYSVEMDGLGRGAAANKRYEELAAKKLKLFERCIEILEKYREQQSTENPEIVKMLKGFYSISGNYEAAKEMKALEESLISQ